MSREQVSCRYLLVDFAHIFMVVIGNKCVIMVTIAHNFTLVLTSILISKCSPELQGRSVNLIKYVYLRPLVRSQEAQPVVDVLEFSIRNWILFQVKKTAFFYVPPFCL